MFKKGIIVSLLIFLTVLFAACEPETPAGDGTTNPQSNDIMSLTPMKDQFADHFMIGNIYSPGYDWNRLNRHYNAVTAENMMKPYALVSSITSSNVNLNSSGINTAKSFVDTAIKNGHKVIGHTLLWHSQNPQTLNLPSDKDQAIETMRKYITAVAGHSAFKGRIYSWDVLNEVFPDSGYNASSDWKAVMRSNNPWFRAIGSDFVYEGFLAARNADPNAILYYNDYNTDQLGKRTMIRNMVIDVNNRYLASGDKPEGEDPNRLLIEGVGLQEHHNTNVPASNVKASIDMFRAMSFEGSNRKIILSVSELDVLAQGYSSAVEGANKPPLSGNNLSKQAELYGAYFKVYLENSDIIERVSFWGITDDRSWRSGAQPLLFDNNGKAKEAYYKVIEALEN